ncbi:hypothetical protein HYX14_00175 [Candidatus Woesearchaeota archaeon]|nr:hypothetical protein [Candidatus Woesearchaeota archaeon]
MQKEVIIFSVLFIFLLSCAPQSVPPEKDIPLEQVNSQPSETVQNFPTQKSQSQDTSKNEETNKTPSKEFQTKEILTPEITLTPEQKLWKQRVDNALAPTFCPPVEKQTYPENYYLGKLTDTHLHIPSIPDWPADEDAQMKTETPEGRFGGPQALLGWNVKISEISCTIQHEGTHNNFAFFPVYDEEISAYQLEIWNKTMQQYPDAFTPFIMSSGNDDEPNGFPTVDAKTLQKMLAVYPRLFSGYGEIGLYARENGGSPELPPDAARLQEIYPLIRKNNLAVYFHLGDGHKDNFEKVLEQNPKITFIFHGDQLSIDEVDDVLNNHQNVYYGIDDFFGGARDLFEMFVGKSKEKYLAAANQRFNSIVEQGVSDWKSLIEKHPDRVLWGIDRGDAVWNYDIDVGLMQVKIARAFIGKLNPAVQEKFAYKNALRALGDGEK